MKERRENAYIQDTFSHEQYIVLKENEKSVLISGCAHNGEQKVVDNKDGKTHKVICEECDEVIAEKAEHDYSATTGKCACGARKPHNDAGKNPNLDNVPKTGSNGTVITLCSFLLMGAMGIVACVKTDKKYI